MTRGLAEAIVPQAVDRAGTQRASHARAHDLPLQVEGVNFSRCGLGIRIARGAGGDEADRAVLLDRQPEPAPGRGVRQPLLPVGGPPIDREPVQDGRGRRSR
jgi:hypothetical protein